MIDVKMARLQPSRDTDNATVDEYAEAVSAAKERYLAVVFLSGLAEYRYEQMLRTMENDYLRGDKLSYPTTLNKAYELATNWRVPGPKKTRGPHRQYEIGNTFVQSGGYRGKTNGDTNDNANVYNNNTKNRFTNDNRKPPSETNGPKPEGHTPSIEDRLFPLWGDGPQSKGVYHGPTQRQPTNHYGGSRKVGCFIQCISTSHLYHLR